MNKDNDLIERLREELHAIGLPINETSIVIENLRPCIEELEGFERMVKMPGQNMALRLMDAEQRIEELERELNDARSGDLPT